MVCTTNNNGSDNTIINLKDNIELNTTSDDETAFNNKLTAISDRAKIYVWGNQPRSLQSVIIPGLLKMHMPPNILSTISCARHSSGGKSSIPQTVGVINTSITLIIENT